MTTFKMKVRSYLCADESCIRRSLKMSANFSKERVPNGVTERDKHVILMYSSLCVGIR